MSKIYELKSLCEDLLESKESKKEDGFSKRDINVFKSKNVGSLLKANKDFSIRVTSMPKDDDSVFVIADRLRFRGKKGQDQFSMFVVDKNGIVDYDIGSHVSLEGAKKFAHNHGWKFESGV